MSNILEEAIDRFIAAVGEKINLPDEVMDIFTVERGKVIKSMQHNYGGDRAYIPKPPSAAPEKRQAVTSDYLANLPEKEIVDKHGISRATLYRMIKR